MAVTKKDALDQAKLFVREDAGRLKQHDWDFITKYAKQHFDKDKPLIKTGDITGDSGFDYTLPTGFDADFSVIRSVEFPSGQQSPTFIDRDAWTIYDNGTIRKFRLLEQTASAAQTIRLKFTMPHDFDDTDTDGTIPNTDLLAISCLMAGYAAQALRGDFLRSVQANLSADSVDFTEKVAQMKDLAEDMFAKYQDLVTTGTGEGSIDFVTLSKDFDMRHSWGADFIIHPKGNR